MNATVIDMNTAATPKPQGKDVPMQGISLEQWAKKYQLRDRDGTPIDQDLQGTCKRVARALADLEPRDRDHWYDEFLWALNHGAVGAGRIMSNAGAWEYKPATSLINCTVSGTIRDSMKDILQRNVEAGLTLKAGCGIGYDFSTLRPRGAYVRGAGASTSGPLSFMDIYDKTCFTVSSAGGRRGAQMATLDIGHPDIIEFIRAKREPGRLRQFNLSVLIRREFIEAVDTDDEWALAFPCHPDELETLDPVDVIYREWPVRNHYVADEQGRVAMRVYNRVKARRLWNAIMTSTYDYADPGFILIDEMNVMNNNWWCENIRATNPCGEQGLPPEGACLLGSINLTRFVTNPFKADAAFDWDGFRRVVSIFTRMLDNVVEMNGLPLPGQREEILRKRRHGMGYFGAGSAMAMLRIRYGSPASLTFTEQVTRELAMVGWQAALDLAREKGPAPIMNEVFEVTKEMLAQRPEMAADGHKPGDKLKGAVLHAKYSRYMQRIAAEDPELVAQLAEVGARFTHHSSIAPTGTISLTFGNNASNGIEPSFSHRYLRNVIVHGKKSKAQSEVFSYEYLAYRTLIDSTADPDKPVAEGADAPQGRLPAYFVTADSVAPREHVDVQAAAQKWVDSSISKTINVPTQITFKDFQDIYLYAVHKGLKGCTTFRFNPEVHQGVLVREDDLKNTVYRFTLDDGAVVELKGDEKIMYEGEEHTAANLYDALKEGYFGKY